MLDNMVMQVSYFLTNAKQIKIKQSSKTNDNDNDKKCYSAQSYKVKKADCALQ